MVKSTSYYILVIKLGKRRVMSFIAEHYLGKPPNPSENRSCSIHVYNLTALEIYVTSIHALLFHLNHNNT